MSHLSRFLRAEAAFEITEWSGVFALAAVAVLLFQHKIGLHLGVVVDQMLGSVVALLP